MCTTCFSDHHQVSAVGVYIPGRGKVPSWGCTFARCTFRWGCTFQIYPPPYPTEGTWDQAYLPVDRMTHTCENITFPQLRWWAVNIMNHFAFYPEPGICSMFFVLRSRLKANISVSYAHFEATTRLDLHRGQTVTLVPRPNQSIAFHAIMYAIYTTYRVPLGFFSVIDI